MAKKIVTHKGNDGVFAASVSQSYEGPLPPPADLVAYKVTIYFSTLPTKK